MRALTLHEPADSPKIVTLFGSPPKLAMLRCTHWSAAISLERALGDHWSLHAGVGRAVRSPTVLERYSDRFPASRFQLAADIDPAYADAFASAYAAGVEKLVLGTRITPQGVEVAGPLSRE